ncbi:MAG: hypothetical protein J6U20_13890 [Fibrobacter sp.]|nr:hypothetical protein [Fibrobacter sp.]
MMRNIVKLLWVALFVCGLAYGSNLQMFFAPCDSELCVSNKDMAQTRHTASRVAKTTALAASIRTMVIEPQKDASSVFHARLLRPVFILDGIYLSMDEVRTLDDFYRDVEEFGIPEMFLNMGYTPILVQFSETVTRSVKDNAELFAKMLAFFSSNNLVPFPDAVNEGFVVLGISQGGIIGRYGAYLYDMGRKKSDAPIKLFASLDSPHQGAVMPKGLLETIWFWSKEGGSADAEAFVDLINGPGASDLLLRQESSGFEADTDTSRFLFGEYRKACSYKGFPTVLISQGPMRGMGLAHATQLFTLRREAQHSGSTYGRAISGIYSYGSPNTQVSHNYMYEFSAGSEDKYAYGDPALDFIQGSTYPFAKTMYEALRSGFEKEMPDSFKRGLGPFKWTFHSKWIEAKLGSPSSTFIPTASAMDLNCDGDLAIRKECAATVSAQGFSFENPGSRSSAGKVYAVDPTHPRYYDIFNGRHIEPAVREDGSVDTLVLRGMQTDVWRFFCELAKIDYDSSAGEFRNPMLTGLFSPGTSCLDLSKMPDVIRNGGVLQKTKFPYARYNFSAGSTEIADVVTFDLPAGWQKVALFDYGADIPANSIFEVQIKVESPKSNWMKAELMVQKGKSGSGVQMEEINVEQDGKYHLLRWQMPSATGALANYRWFNLILNSAGAKVALASVRLVRNSVNHVQVPAAISSPNIYPSTYKRIPWSENVKLSDYSDNLGAGLSIEVDKRYDGMYLDFGRQVNLDGFSMLEVIYWPGSCQNIRVYFDSKVVQNANLGGGVSKNGLVVKQVPLSEIINTEITPESSYSVSRLNMQGIATGERCIVKSIQLK